MKTDALIERLSENLAPVPRLAALRILALGLGAGALVSFVLMVLWLGIRPDLMTAISTEAYWMKFFYTLAAALTALWTLERLARPGARALVQGALEILPLGVIALLAIAQWTSAPASLHTHLLMGASHTVCPWRIVALALPIFVGVLWSMRRLAPTRPALSGAVAGLLAGAAGAWIYAFHCDENAAVFVAVWYTFGIALVGLLGAMVGRWLLRW